MISRILKIPPTTEIQIHGFADASEKGYGACVYLRSSNTKGEHCAALICSKTSRASQKKTLYVAMYKIIKLIQEEAFAKEIRDLSQNKKVDNKSSR